MSTETDETGAPSSDGTIREIAHDEFEPIGTLVLVAIYFLILGLMWIFTYFIEFLGRGPTPMVV